jgi:hypothetical protein
VAILLAGPDYVSTIEGEDSPADAAEDAVRQSRYRPLRVKGTLIDTFLVVVTFEKNGKVH